MAGIVPAMRILDVKLNGDVDARDISVLWNAVLRTAMSRT
jgi:hypothetical protein